MNLLIVHNGLLKIKTQFLNFCLNLTIQTNIFYAPNESNNKTEKIFFLVHLGLTLGKVWPRVKSNFVKFIIRQIKKAPSSSGTLFYK
jgi:hypothetical protein